ncbi:MAG: hypothetical protein IID08_06475, partial [Candidatus Hydrogenedentes bacterium]|nr:hypothetical protein [Candidatus Hydrogenedentota bacterium]
TAGLDTTINTACSFEVELLKGTHGGSRGRIVARSNASGCVYRGSRIGGLPNECSGGAEIMRGDGDVGSVQIFDL